MDTELKKFMDSLEVDKDVSADVYEQTARRMLQSRSVIFYYIWKKLKEMHPEIDATEVLREASKDLGKTQANLMVKRLGKTDVDAKEAMLAHTSKMNVRVFGSEIQELTPERSVRVFKRCPHVEAFEDLGASPEEIRTLCRDMLCYGDYATFEPFETVEFIWEHTIAEGGEHVCRNIIQKKS